METKTQTNKPLFSFALIMKNEEKTLPRLVASLKEFQERGGKIFALDTGSTDKTVEVARSLGCEVTEVGDKYLTVLTKEQADAINAEFVVEDDVPIVKEGDKNFDFSSARNFIAGIADTDFVSSPDCDEIYTKFDIDKINEAIEKGADQFEYNFVFAHDKDGKPTIQFFHSKFYDKRKMKWVGVIHEVLKGSNINQVHLGEDTIKLEHFQNVETNRNGYLVGLALDTFWDKTNDRNTHYFARELLYKGRYKSAIKQFERHTEMPNWNPEGAQSMTYIGDCYMYLGKPKEALKWYTMSFDKEPNRREPLMKLAEYYRKREMWQQAVAYASAALTVKGMSFYSNYQPYYNEVPHEILYLGYWYLGNKDLAKQHYDIACTYSDKYVGDKHFFYGND